MKYLVNRDKFKTINENNSSLTKTSLDEDDLFELFITANSGDIGLFIEDFDDKYNCNSYDWLKDEEKRENLSKLFITSHNNDNNYKFIVLQGIYPDGDNGNEVQKYIRDNWTIFASNDNKVRKYKTYECILYYHPNASRANNSINKFKI